MAGLFGGNKSSTNVTKYAGVSLQTSVRGMVIPVVYGTQRIGVNLLWYGNFQAHAVKSGGGGKGGAIAASGGKGGNSSYTYSTSVILGLCEGPITGIGKVWLQDTSIKFASLSATLFVGNLGQAAWGYLTSNFPTNAAPYSGIAYLGIPTYLLGSQTQLPNHNFEVFGVFTQNTASDVNPARIVWDILTNTQYGMAFDSQLLGDHQYTTLNVTIPQTGSLSVVVGAGDFVDNLSVSVATAPLQSALDTTTRDTYHVAVGVPAQGYATYTFNASLRGSVACVEYVRNTGAFTQYSNYVRALGLYLSPAYTQVASCASHLSDITKYTNAEFVTSGGTIRIVPYGEVAVSSNSSTYIPYVTDVVINHDVMLSNNPPISVKRKRAADCDNIVKLVYSDRNNSYNHETVTVYDQSLIDTYGMRTQNITTEAVTNGITAMIVADLLLARCAVRNTYTFSVDLRYSLLDVMDVICCVDPTLGVNALMRIIEIHETSYTLSITCEDYIVLGSASNPIDVAYGYGYTNNADTDAPPVTAIAVLEVPSSMWQNPNQFEVWLFASSSSPNYGGCEVWVSWDDLTYTKYGDLVGKSIIGVVSTAITDITDPYVGSWAVDLTSSGGTLEGGTPADADAWTTLCVVGTEMLAYSNATLASAGVYSFTSYTRRGLHDTTATAHATGEQFIRCNDTYCALTTPLNNVGRTLYYKLVPFNLYKMGKPDLSVCNTHVHVIGSAVTVTHVTGLYAYTTGSSVVITWVLDDTGDYRIYYGHTTGTFGSASLLASLGHVSQYITNALSAGVNRIYVTRIVGGVSSDPVYYDVTV